MLDVIKNMVKENGIRETLIYLTTKQFTDEELRALEDCHILNKGFPSISLLSSFDK